MQLPELNGSLADAGQAVIAPLAEGRLGPDDASTVMQALASQVRIVESASIENRIAALEQAALTKGKP